ncbi:MAG TPA: PxKF domain-containing protein, partial [Miltoncostaeaceae bacterium]|nr:PxKF domain-containing protein [Miltoncostaeaceae bacterium]
VFNRGALLVRGSTLTGNTAASGAALADAGTARLENSTVSGNGGGAALHGGGRLALTHVTLVAGAPGPAGVPSLVQVTPAGAVRAANTLFQGATEGPACAGGVEDGGGGLAASAPGCPGASGAAALGPLAPAGGRTAVHVPGDGSAARDAAADAECLPADQRGLARPQGAACDVGAVEVRAVTPPPPRDTTPPRITPSVTGPAGDAGWYRGDVTVAWTVADDESPPVPGPGCAPLVVRDDTAGRVLECTATSEGGEATGRVEVRRDTAPPRIAVETPAAGAAYRLGEPVTLLYSCADDIAGVVECAGPRPSGSPVDTSAVGGRTWSWSARDAAGNTAEAGVAFRVVFPFGGFPSPPPVPRLTRATAGGRVNVQFDLGADRGEDVLAPVAPAVSQRVACGDGAPQGAEAPVLSAKRSVVYFDGRLRRYVLPWRTDRRWAGTCRRLVLRLSDGAQYAADFRFVRPVS